MTNKRRHRHSSRYSKATTSTTKSTASTGKATISTDKAPTLTSKAASSSSKATSPAGKAKKSGGKTTLQTGKVAMPTSDFSHMRRRFYIVRPEPNKICVPMVALDELPAGFHLKGVPSTVTPQQINEWDMARVGADIELRDSFVLEHDHIKPSQRGRQSNEDDQNSPHSEKTEASTEAVSGAGTANEDSIKGSSMPDVPVKPNQLPKPETAEAKSEREEQASVSALQQQANVGPAPTRPFGTKNDIAHKIQEAAHGVMEKSKWEKENDRSKTQDAATPGVYGKKKYCTHWIRTGNCDYMQEGCRYLHVIPDAETRLTIGIRDMPRWAKEDLPSPPRDINPLRRRSWSPPKEKRDSQKDWRNRGNRKIQAELPAGPTLVSRAALERPSTPTTHPFIHKKQYGLQHSRIEDGATQAIANAQVNLTAPRLPSVSQDTHAKVQEGQQNAFPNDSTIAAHRIIPAAAASTQMASLQPTQQRVEPQKSFSRQPHFSPMMSHSAPLSMQSPSGSSTFYNEFSPSNDDTQQFGPSHMESSYNHFQSHQSPRGTPFETSSLRTDSSRWGYPSAHPFGMNTHRYSQSRPTPPPGSPIPSTWRRGFMASPTPSFSEASVGTIGHGRPGVASPIIGTPILHKRLFRQPSESQYVQAKPQPSGKPRNGDVHRSHKGKGMTTFEAQKEDGSRSGELGNLIALE